jgi:hypothetical protein
LASVFPLLFAPVDLAYKREELRTSQRVSIAILDHIADSRLVLLKPAEWTTQVLA